MNRNTLLLIFSVTGIILGLAFYSNHLKNAEITTAQTERADKNALQILIDSTGNQHWLVNSNLKGKVVVFNIWASWCGPCMGEIPELNKLADEFHSDKIVFIALNADDAAKEMLILAHQNITFNYQLLFNQTALIDAIASLRLKSEANAIPVNMVLNPEGKVQFYYVGNDPDKLKKVHDYLQTVVK